MDLAGYYFVRELASRELVYGRPEVPGFSECGPDGIAGIVLCARGVLSYSTRGGAKPYFLGYYLLCAVRVGTTQP